MSWVDREIKRQHRQIIRSLKRKKNRDRHFIRKYKNGKTIREQLEEYDLRDAKTCRFIKRQLINEHGAVCAICGRPIDDMKDCTLDHIRPRSKGGLTTIENCQLAHYDCNQAKDDTW